MTCFVFLIFYIVTTCFESGNAVAHNVDFDGNILKQVLSKLDGMQAKIDQQELSMTSLNHTVADLSSTVTQLQEHIDRMETSEAKLKRTVRNVVDTAAQLRQKIADLSEKPAIEFSEETYQIVENISANNRIKPDNSERRIQKYPIKTEGKLTRNGNISSSRGDTRQTTEQVAFCAYLDHVIRHLGQNQTIVYNRVLLNEAGAYSINTGVFRTPVSGIYLFSWSVTARKLQGEHSYDIWVKLVVNGEMKLSTAAESQVVTYDNQSSNTVVLLLKQGDEVWTSNYRTPDIFGSDYERTTSFTGVLLHAD